HERLVPLGGDPASAGPVLDRALPPAQQVGEGALAAEAADHPLRRVACIARHGSDSKRFFRSAGIGVGPRPFRDVPSRWHSPVTPSSYPGWPDPSAAAPPGGVAEQITAMRGQGLNWRAALASSLAGLSGARRVAGAVSGSVTA